MMSQGEFRVVMAIWLLVLALGVMAISAPVPA